MAGGLSIKSSDGLVDGSADNDDGDEDGNDDGSADNDVDGINEGSDDGSNDGGADDDVEGNPDGNPDGNTDDDDDDCTADGNDDGTDDENDDGRLDTLGETLGGLVVPGIIEDAFDAPTLPPSSSFFVMDGANDVLGRIEVVGVTLGEEVLVMLLGCLLVLPLLLLDGEIVGMVVTVVGVVVMAGGIVFPLTKTLVARSGVGPGVARALPMAGAGEELPSDNSNDKSTRARSGVGPGDMLKTWDCSDNKPLLPSLN